MGTTGQSITLANSIIGVGILAMPFCFQQCGILLATLILLSMGLMSRLCCYFLLKSAFLARRRNFEYLAFHVFGPAGKIAVEVGIIGFLMGTCIAYFVVVGDLGPQIISKMFNINQSDILRTSIMVIVSLVCVLPLGLLRNVDSLSNVSAATIGFYFCLVIKVIAEAASQLPSGDWHRRMELWKPSGVLQCVPIFSMALFCQTQLFEIFESLPSLSLEKMNLVTKNAINICTSVYFTLGVFGYIAFCSQDISGNILMSLSPTMASDVIKLGFVMSLAFSFPLIIFPCRASLYSFLYKKVHSSHHDHIINHSIPETTFRCITVGIVAVALFISLLIPNIELVLGLVGSTIGVLVCVVFPAACFVNVTFKNTNERVLAKGVIMFGLVIMVLGTYANLQAAESQIEKYDGRYTQERIDKIVEDFFEKKKMEEHLNPTPEKDGVKMDAVDSNNNIKKDSEVQPPNPVPPDTNSNEIQNPDSKMDKLNSNDNKIINDVLLPEKLKEADAADTVSDSHPKNLKNKLNGAKLVNEIAANVDKVEVKPKDPSPSEENKVEKLKLIKQQQLIETMKQHGEEQKELMQEQKEILDEIIKTKKEMNIEKLKESKPVIEPKPDEDNKQQKLIDTIKQHGVEQKELMKEQKEILDEIKELKQNKDTGTNDAKKIAVESIKQIADMAIKSLGGVTEKPVGQPVEVKKDERLEKLTHEAVQEIAKKAVETIEAIQEIKEKPGEVKPANKPNEISKKAVEPIAAIQEIKDKPEEVKPIEPSKKAENDKPLETVIAPEKVQNVVPNKVETNQDKAPILNTNQNNHENVVQGNVNRELLSNIAPPSQVNNDAKQEHVKTIATAPITNNLGGNRNVDNGVKNVQLDNIVELQIPKETAVKQHSHSPDEPQSYKEGEDFQIKNEHPDTKLDQNIPLAVAMSDKAKLENIIRENRKLIDDDDKAKVEEVNAGKANLILEDNLVRQKRAVIDCSNTDSLKPADRRGCDILLDRYKDPLPTVDLNNEIARIGPLHLSRSLKSYDADNKR